MARQLSAVLVGVIIAVGVIFAVFDKRVSYRGVASQVTQLFPQK